MILRAVRNVPAPLTAPSGAMSRNTSSAPVGCSMRKRHPALCFGGWREELTEKSIDLAHGVGIYLPLLAINCAIIGGSLFMVERRLDLAESAVFGLGTGTGIGWALAIVTLAAIRERLRYANVPKGLEGLGIAFIVAGLMSMGFSAFVGVRVL